MSGVDGDVAVLHVDSDEHLLDLAARYLEEQDDRLVVDSVTSVQAALEQLEQGGYDAVVSDYDMPEVDGLEFLRILREKRETELPFIIFTGKGHEDVAADAFTYGANRYVQKSGDPDSTYTILSDTIVKEVGHARAQEKLQASEAKYRSVYENAPLAFVIWNDEFEILDWNDQAAAVFGWSREEAIGEDVRSLIVPEDGEIDLNAILEQVGERGQSHQCISQNVTADGDQIECQWYDAPLETAGADTHVMSLAFDITDDRRRRVELQHYATAVEGTDDSIYMLDTEGQYVFANREHLTRLAGDGKIDCAEESEIVGRPYRTIHSDEEADRLEGILADVIEAGEPRTEEYEFQTEEKCSYRTYSPVTDPDDGSITGVVVISKDITKRKRAEEREAFLHSLLRHDLRNKIQIAHGYHGIIRDSDDPDERDEYLDAAQDTLSEGLELIEKIGILSELESDDDQAEARPLQSVIEQVLSTKRAFAEDEGIEIEYEREEGMVRGGPLLEELFSNVLENAIVHADASTIRITTSGSEDQYVVHVEDDGVGLPDDDVMRLFERGFSSGETGGSGLGLYLVREIARSYGGDVELSTSELGGMKLDITLERAS